MAARTKKNTSWTLVSAFEEILKKSKGCELTDTFYTQVDAPAKYLKKVLGLTPFQSFALAFLIDNGASANCKQMANYAKTSTLKIMCYNDELLDLRAKKMIKRSYVCCAPGDKPSVSWFVHPDFLKTVLANQPYVPRSLGKYTAKEVIGQLYRWMRILDMDCDLYQSTVLDVKDLLAGTKHLHFSSELSKMQLTDGELMLFLVAVVSRIYCHKDSISEMDYDDILAEDETETNPAEDINNGKGNLVALKLLENVIEDGVAQPNNFVLTAEARMGVLSEFANELNTAVAKTECLMPEKIAPKNLFYNQSEGEQVARLTTLLSQEQFKGIQERLKSANMRPGFACLFHGAPGTGKTETVLQLARMTGRPLLQVNVADLKSKWVGESEKMVTALFNRYEQMCKEYEVIPILFFNEADAIFGNRKVGAENAVDKMENSLQNIILQAMETLPGILIATTNLTENFDAAFERRFLYKINFHKPEKKVKANIWHSMMPNLTEGDSAALAEKYDFSGGQIENIVRKQMVDNILYGNEVSLNSICKLCDEELFSKNKHNRIGF